MKRNSISSTMLAPIVAAVLTLSLATSAFAGWPEGVAAFKSGNLGTAAAEFQKVVDAQPDWPGGHFMLGWTYLKQKKSQQAVQHLRKAYDLNPKDANTQLRLGEAYVQSGRHSDAVAFLSKINSSALPKDMQGYLAQLKAVALSKTGQTDQAVAEFAKAANADPGDADKWFAYGSAAYSAGDTSTGIRALAKAVQLDGGDLAKQKVYAQALLKQGRTTKGNTKMDAYRKAAAAAQRVVAGNGSFDNLMLLGGAELGGKNYDGAIATFQRAAAKNASDWLPHFYVGQAHTAKGQYRSAESALRTALDRAGSAADQAKIWRQMGYVYEKQKNFNEAISAYRRGGDEAAAVRVDENRKISEYNQGVEQEAEEIQKLKEEQDRIKKELQELPGGPPPGI